jgi:hypothetical protein
MFVVRPSVQPSLKVFSSLNQRIMLPSRLGWHAAERGLLQVLSGNSARPILCLTSSVKCRNTSNVCRMFSTVIGSEASRDHYSNQRNHRSNRGSGAWAALGLVVPASVAVVWIQQNKRKGPALADAAVSYQAGLAALKEVCACMMHFACFSCRHHLLQKSGLEFFVLIINREKKQRQTRRSHGSPTQGLGPCGVSCLAA